MASPRRTAPTSRDVATRAGVAQSTVSAVLSGKRAVAAATKARVEAAMLDLGYEPNAGARTLRTSRTNVVALVVHLEAGVDAAETVPYIDTIIEEARHQDYDVVLSTTREGPEGIVRLARRSICDAFILMDITPGDERVAAVATLGKPVVLIGRPDDARGVDVVDFDTRRAAEMLVDELAASGHAHVVVLGEVEGQERLRFVTEFQEGARDRAAAQGLGLTVVDRASRTWEAVRDVGDELLAHRDDRLGIIARTQRDMDWIVRLLQMRGLVPGRDVSLVCMCPDEAAQVHPRPVTNVSPRPRELSQLAMRLLFARLDGDSSPARLELVEPDGVVRRATTTPFDPLG